jgi:anti-anti-sigma factor
MKITSYKAGTAAVVCPRQAIVQADCAALRTTLDEVRSDTRADIVVDLTEVPYIDSAGLELLIDVTREVNDSGRRMFLAAADELCREIFRITDVGDHLNLRDTVDEAIRRHAR